MLKGVLRPNPKTGMYLTAQRQARRVLVDWLKTLASGSPRSLHQVAAESGWKPAKLLRVLRKDPKLAEEFFTPLTVEMKAALATAVARGAAIAVSEDTPSQEVRLWAEFFAKHLGGLFQAKNHQPLLVLQQLIPNLPPPAKEIEVKVLSAEETAKSLSDLEAG